eukprot:3688537-Rhodomonas_salina.2
MGREGRRGGKRGEGEVKGEGGERRRERGCLGWRLERCSSIRYVSTGHRLAQGSSIRYASTAKQGQHTLCQDIGHSSMRYLSTGRGFAQNT